jgi:hypothetical protein
MRRDAHLGEILPIWFQMRYFGMSGPRVAKQLSATRGRLLECGDAVETDRLWQVAGLAEAGEGAVLLVDGKDADVSGLRVDGVDEFSVGADSDVHIVATRGIVAEDGSADGGEGAVFADVEAGDVVAAGVRDVNPGSVRRDGVPAVSGGEGWKAVGDCGDGSVGVDLIGGDGGAVGGSGCAGLGDDGCSVGGEGYGEGAGGGVGVDDDRREGAVGLDVEDVDVVCDALGDDEELAVGAEGERGAAGGGGGEEGGGVFDLPELAAVVEVKADEAACAAAVEDIDEAAGLGDGGGLGAAGGSFAEEAEGGGFVDVEDGDVAAACVDGEEEGVVLAEGERALRLKRVGGASAAAAVGVVGDAVTEGAVGVAFEGDDFVFARVVGHDEDSAGGIVGLCRGKNWECGANSDGEHQETSSYFQHLQLLGKTDRARPRKSVE